MLKDSQLANYVKWQINNCYQKPLYNIRNYLQYLFDDNWVETWILSIAHITITKGINICIKIKKYYYSMFSGEHHIISVQIKIKLITKLLQCESPPCNWDNNHPHQNMQWYYLFQYSFLSTVREHNTQKMHIFANKKSAAAQNNEWFPWSPGT